MTKRAIGALLLLLAATGTARADTHVELEAFLGGCGGLGGGGLVGVPLGQHLVLMTGAQGAGVGADDYAGWAIRIPAELKIYIKPPRAGAIAPLLRLGAAYVRGGTEMDGYRDATSGLEGRGGLGVSYLVTERLGVGLDAGLTYGRYNMESSQGDSDTWQVGLDWRLGVVLRL